MRKIKSHKMRLVKGLLIFLGLVIILSSVAWVYRSVWTTRELEFKTAELGSITHEVKVSAYFANEEIPLQSPSTGSLNLLYQEGQRIRKGETIAEVRSQGAAPGLPNMGSAAKIQASIGGLFFPLVDNLEVILTPQNLVNMDIAKLLEQKASPHKPEETVKTGEYIGKIVNNLVPSSAFFELSDLKGLEKGNTIKLRVQERTYNAKIIRLSENPRGVVVQFSQFVAGSIEERTQDIIWITRAPVEGVIIPKSALFTQGEEEGVYVLMEGILQYRKVKKLDENDTKVCVEDLPSGIPVVINPSQGLDGLPSYAKSTSSFAN